MSLVQLRSYYDTPTKSRLNCANQCNCKPAAGYTTNVPPGLPGPSRFSFLIGLCHIGILCIVCYLAVIISVFPRRGFRLWNLKVRCNESCHHLFILCGEATDLALVGSHCRLQALDLLAGSLPWAFLGHWDVVPIDLGFLALLSKAFFLFKREQLITLTEYSVCAVLILELNA